MCCSFFFVIHYHVLFPLLSELACKLWRFRVIALAPEVFAIFLTKSWKSSCCCCWWWSWSKWSRLWWFCSKNRKKIPVLDEEGRSRIFPQLVRHNLNISWINFFSQNVLQKYSKQGIQDLNKIGRWKQLDVNRVDFLINHN